MTTIQARKTTDGNRSGEDADIGAITDFPLFFLMQKNKTEVLELENKITKLRNHSRGFTVNWTQ